MRILVAPLDWGLGHATRCLPVIAALQALGASPVLGCAGPAGVLLRSECPELPFIDLPAYAIRYPQGSMVLSIASQMPRFLWSMRREQLLLRELVRRHELSGVISDNRYGLFGENTPSVLLTHQLWPRIPHSLISPPIQAILGRWIRRFDACWVPDILEAPGLAGVLSHPARHPNTAYLGPVSRFKAMPALSGTRDILCLLSGPEPQRSRLEELLLPQLEATGKEVLVVRGLPHRKTIDRKGKLEIHAHMRAAELNRAMAESRLILGRPGYSTIMDLKQVGGRAIFIPTPGQTEQEYLAERLHRHNICYSAPQHGFDLEAALRAEPGFSGFQPEAGGAGIKRLVNVVDSWLREIS